MIINTIVALTRLDNFYFHLKVFYYVYSFIYFICREWCGNVSFCTCKSQKITCINQFSTSIMSEDNMYGSILSSIMSEDNMCESILSSIMYVLRKRTQIISRGSKHLFQLSHLIILSYLYMLL